MKIAVNTRLLIPNKIAGEANYVYSLLKQLVHIDTSNEYHLLFDRPYDKKLMEFALISPRFRCHVIKPKTRFAPLLDFWINVSIPKFLNEQNIDLFFSPEPFVPLLGNHKCVTTIHDLAFLFFPHITYALNRLNFKIMVKRSAMRADRVIAVSNNTREDIKTNYGIPDERIQVIYHGIKTISRRNVSASERIAFIGNKPYILYVGTVEPRKNLVRLIQAYAKIRTQHVEHALVIAGRRGWKCNDVYELVENLQLQNHVIFTNFVDDETLGQLYRSADAFAYVPLYEGFGMPLTEAMSFGLPIVTSNVSSIPEVVGEAAVKVDPMNIDAIASGLLTVLNDKPAATKLRTLALERSTLFNWERSAIEHLNVFETVFRESGKHRNYSY